MNLKVNSINCLQHNRCRIVIIKTITITSIEQHSPCRRSRDRACCSCTSRLFSRRPATETRNSKNCIRFSLKSKLNHWEHGNKITGVVGIGAISEFVWHAVFVKLIGKLTKWFYWSGTNSFTRVGSRANNNAITTIRVCWLDRQIIIELRRYYRIIL